MDVPHVLNSRVCEIVGSMAPDFSLLGHQEYLSTLCVHLVYLMTHQLLMG